MKSTLGPRHRLIQGVLLTAFLVLGVVLLLVQRPRTQVWAALFNASHVLVALAMTLAIRWGLATRIAGWSAARLSITAFISTILAGAALEAAQLVFPGTASLTDLFRDAAGGVAGILLYHASAVGQRGARLLLRAVAVVLVVVPMASASRALVRMTQVWAQLPAVAAFDGPGNAAQLLAMDGGELEVLATPSFWPQAERKKVGKVTFTARHVNPRVLINNPFADWGSFKILRFTLYSPHKYEFPIVLRIDDIDATLAMTDRFHERMSIAPGHNLITIDLGQVRDSPMGRQLDLAALENVVLYMESPTKNYTLYIERFWLE